VLRARPQFQADVPGRCSSLRCQGRP
jgi:hypothetical protein